MNKKTTALKQFKGKNRKPENELRNINVSIKMSANQRTDITAKAKMCGESRSLYMVMRAYNYYPRQRLSQEERELLRPLFDVRRDIVNISNVLKSLPDKERNAMLHNFKFLVEWMGYINDAAARIMAYLDQVQRPNSIPGKTAPEVGTDEDGDVEQANT